MKFLKNLAIFCLQNPIALLGLVGIMCFCTLLVTCTATEVHKAFVQEFRK